MSNENMAGLLALLYVIVEFIKKVYNDRQAEKLAKTVKIAADEVKNTLAASDVKKIAHLDKQDLVLAQQTSKLEEIQTQTNGMSQKLEAVAFDKGIQSEKDRQDTKGELK